MIWASPMDFELRGSHRWLQNVIPNEYAHIVSLQKSMKAGLLCAGAYLLWRGDEDDKDHNISFSDAIKLDVLLQQKKLGTPLLDCFNFKLEHELRKTNEFENISSCLLYTSPSPRDS